MQALAPWLPAAGILAASVLAGVLVESLVLNRLRTWAAKTQTVLDDFLVESLARPLPYWLAMGGLAAAAQSAPLSARHVLLIHKGVVAIFLLSVTFAAAGIASMAVGAYSKNLKGSARTTGVVDNLVRGLVILLGGLLILANLGISIGPLLGALGVGSLAVALALQDTLTNLFAGLHIVASEVVRVGDYIRLDSGHEGDVSDIGWRVTRILDPGGNTIVLPNSKLANAVVVNFHRPTPDGSVVIGLVVDPACDLAQVERAILEEAQRVQKELPGAQRGYQPLVRFQALEAQQVKCVAILRCERFSERFLMIHEFTKGIQARFKKEGIALPKAAFVLKPD